MMNQKQQGYDVIMPVGETHVKGLQAQLSAMMEITSEKTPLSNRAQSNTNKTQDPLQHSATTKKVYGKFTTQLVQHSPILTVRALLSVPYETTTL